VSAGPLDGVRVVEVAEGVAGPMTGRLLGDAGADVVKVETAAGDRARGWGPPQVDGTSVVFSALNRNKRSVVVDDVAGPDAAGLIAAADVLVVDDGRLDVDTLMSSSPGLVVCVVSGWGPEGPWAGRPGGELPAQLAAEAYTSLGTLGEEPVRLGNDHAAMLTASFAVQGVVAALLVRDEVGGQRVDVSLFGSLLQMRSTLWVALSNPDEWWGFHLDSYVKPPEHGYTCKDRRMYFSVGRVEDRDQLVAELHMDWVRDDPRWDLFRIDTAGGVGRYSHLVHDLWDRGLSQWTYDEAAAIIERYGGWACPYLDYEEFIEDDHVRQMGLVVEVENSEGTLMREVRPPWQFSETPAEIRRPAPRLGADTAEILRAVRSPAGADGVK
jgi:crotonobetainyl-CoA:carnitine CoA-transferase CaiB-like acyl-CoA transferase